MYQQLLEKVATEKLQFGRAMQPPASEAEIEALVLKSRTRLGAELPADYLDFLRRTNGYSWNGLGIFATHEMQIVGSTDKFVHDFTEMNLYYRDNSDYKNRLVFGDGNMDVYVYEIADKQYAIVDRVPGNVIERLSSFDELISRAIEDHL